MASKVKLKDLTLKIGSGSTPRGGKEAYLDHGEICLIRSQNIYNHFFSKTGLVYISNEQASKLKNVEVQKDDILINITGDSIARNMVIGSEYLPARVNQHVSIIRCDTKKMDPYYLSAILTSEQMQRQLLSLGEVGGTRAALTKKMLEDLEIPIVDMKVQHSIGRLLKVINEKITINQKMISELEELAQTLFKRWFLDFEFPNNDGVSYKSSGGEMKKSEIGEIPKGWEVELLGDIAVIQNGFAFKSNDYSLEGIKVLRTLNIEKNGLLINNEDLKYLPYSFYLEEKYANQRLEKFDTLMVMVGATIGKLGMVLSNNLPSLQNQNMWRFRPKVDSLSSTVLYFYVKQSVEKSLNWRSGSAREFYRKDSFSKISVAMPPESLLLLSKSIFEDIFEKINNLNSQNELLYEVRSTLLPRILSGEIVLPNEIEVTEHVPIP